MTDKPLYEDRQIKIDYYYGNTTDFYLQLKSERNEIRHFRLQRGFLEDFAKTARGKLESKINNLYPLIVPCLEEEKINIDDFHIVLLQSLLEHASRICQFQREQSKSL